LFPAKIRLSFDLTKRFFYFIPLPYTSFGAFSTAPATLYGLLDLRSELPTKNLQRFPEILPRFSENLLRFLENLPLFLPNLGDKFEIN